MSYAKFDGFDIPYVSAVRVRRTFIGERERTVLGTLRQDSLAIKKAWEITTDRMTRAEAETLLNYLDGQLYAVGDFWLHEFGAESNTIAAIVEAESVDEDIVQFRKNGTWHEDGRVLTLTVLER